MQRVEPERLRGDNHRGCAVCPSLGGHGQRKRRGDHSEQQHAAEAGEHAARERGHRHAARPNASVVLRPDMHGAVRIYRLGFYFDASPPPATDTDGPGCSGASTGFVCAALHDSGGAQFSSPGSAEPDCLERVPYTTGPRRPTDVSRHSIVIVVQARQTVRFHSRFAFVHCYPVKTCLRCATRTTSARRRSARDVARSRASLTVVVDPRLRAHPS